jgi:hypothetical protein
VDIHDKVSRSQEESAAEVGSSSSGEIIPPITDETLGEDHSMPTVDAALARVREDHTFDVIRRTFAVAESQQVESFLAEAKKLALKLNKFLQRKVKGTTTIEYSSKPRGSLALNRIIPTIIAQNPQFLYRKYPKKILLHHVLLLIDLSQSTLLSSSGTAWSGSSFTYQVKHAICIAAMTLILAVLEQGGHVVAYFFADADNPNHGTKLDFRRETLSQATGQLLQKEAGGSTRLDEVLGQIEDRDLKTICSTIDGMFVLMDGAPMGTSNSLEDDDRVQGSTVARLKSLERHFPCYILWGRSEGNPKDFDEPFFRWCDKELQHTATINVGSFANFPRYLHEVWAKPPPHRTNIVLPYNTELRFPFELTRSTIDFARETFVGDSAEEQVDHIIAWVIQNVKYRLPNAMEQDYQTAQEVYKSRHGCCGEVSNLICAFMRALGIPAGVLDITYLGRVRLQHACVGYVDAGQAKLVDVCMGSENIARRGVAEPMSDERWAHLMDFWRTERGSVVEAVAEFQNKTEDAEHNTQETGANEWVIAKF